MATISRYLKCNRPNKKGECEITIRYYHEHPNPRYFDTGIRIHPRHWNKKKRFVRDTHHMAFDHNKLITHYEYVINKVKTDLIIAGEIPDRDTVKKMADKLLKPFNTGRDSLESYYTDYLNYIKENYTHSTYKNHKSSYNHLMAIIDNGFKLSDVSRTLYLEYLDHCALEEMSNNTTGKYIKNLLAFFNWCEKDGLIKKQQYKDFKPIGHEKNILYLSYREWQQLKFVNVSGNPHLEYVKDLCLFSISTGYRRSDVFSLKKDMLYYDGEDLYITKVLKKGTKFSKKYIPPMGKMIAEKYLKRSDSELVFDVKLSQGKLVGYVKDICREAKINAPFTDIKQVGDEIKNTTDEKWTFVGFHTMRMTHAMTLKEFGAEITVVKDSLNHTSEATTRKFYQDQLVYKDLKNEAFG